MNKILFTLRKTMHVWWFELRTILFSTRWLVISVITFLLVHFYLKDILIFAKDYDLGMYPAAIPFLFADGTFACLGILMVIFMVSVFPINNHLQQNVLIQSGCMTWGNAQFLTMSSLVFLWIAELQVFVCIVIGGRIDFSGWGKVWGSCSSGVLYELGYVNIMDVQREVLMAYQPGEALVISLLFLFLMGIFFGEFIFFIDGLCRNSIGEILLSTWSLAYLIIANFKGFDGVHILQKLSPKSWLSISRYIGQPQSLTQAVLIMLGLILLFYILNQLLIKKKRIALQ